MWSTILLFADPKHKPIVRPQQQQQGRQLLFFLLSILFFLQMTHLFFLTTTNALGTPQCECTNYPDLQIVDDDELSNQLAHVRDQFMKTVALKDKFTRLDATILLPIGNDTMKWRRGSVNPRQLSYPASCVKLAYLVSSMHWCMAVAKRNRVDCIEEHTHPMITYSDNLETGFVVDIITEQANIYDLNSANDVRFKSWMEKRNFTMRYLSSENLIGNQVFVSKTYPTNSGEWPIGAEDVQRKVTGGNAMASCCAASLVLHTIYRLPKEQSDYAKRLLYHRRFDDWSAIAPGLPPGTLLHNKIGNAYNDINDLAHITLPNGQVLILAVLSNGYQRPSDTTILSRFMEMLLQRLSLVQNLPPIVTLTTDNTNLIQFNTQDGWMYVNNSRLEEGVDRIGNSFVFLPPYPKKATTFSWSVILPEDGLYEVTVYSSTLSTSSSSQYSVPCVVNYYPVASSSDYSYPIRFSSWTKIGDFLLYQGLNKNVVQVQVPQNYPYPVVINAIKFSKYPNQ
ncbi:hypothetical protein FDP41_013034 [Naegleria fowleri]|uniref:Beta-lactamase class A catalytic domain-containing protein n=1 Tax=Naegleria fowleri TaxID=5763 RepID=A0A6A5C0P0_NAEFO|nr:uncharacterized protein FDP41_013034 [Naegleria fowleri]KAF0981246.1 hypothetical protein FDP41_013034 [Naegleria fowleri]